MIAPTRRQIILMAEEAGISDHAAAERLVRLTLAAFRPAPINAKDLDPPPLQENTMTDYREDWDMSTTEGSQCFASAIMSRIVGVDNIEEEDREWLAEYLKVNSAKMPTKLANSTLDDSLRELFFYHAGTQEEGGLAWMTEQEFYAAAREAIANFIRTAVDEVVPKEPAYMRDAGMGPDAYDRSEQIRGEFLAMANKLDPLPTTGEHHENR